MTVTMRPIMTADELRSHCVETYGRDYSESDDGYSDMEAEAGRGWHALSGWGLRGWDLGDWPFVVFSFRNVPATSVADAVGGHEGGAFELLQTVEGDRTVWRFTSREDRSAAIDYLFVWYGLGREYDEWAAAGLTPDKRPALDAGTLRVPEEFRGPYRG